MTDLMDKRAGDVKFTYVPGHQGVDGNEKADDLLQLVPANIVKYFIIWLIYNLHEPLKGHFTLLNNTKKNYIFTKF